MILRSALALGVLATGLAAFGAAQAQPLDKVSLIDEVEPPVHGRHFEHRLSPGDPFHEIPVGAQETSSQIPRQDPTLGQHQNVRGVDPQEPVGGGLGEEDLGPDSHSVGGGHDAPLPISGEDVACTRWISRAGGAQSLDRDKLGRSPDPDSATGPARRGADP